MKVHWAASALADLERIYSHVRKSNPSAAVTIIKGIHDGCLTLELFPERGRVSRIGGKREMVFQSLPYIAVYRISKEGVRILHIFHSAQNWP
jgi:toxin ParE1/3/4